MDNDGVAGKNAMCEFCYWGKYINIIFLLIADDHQNKLYNLTYLQQLRDDKV